MYFNYICVLCGFRTSHFPASERTIKRKGRALRHEMKHLDDDDWGFRARGNETSWRTVYSRLELHLMFYFVLSSVAHLPRCPQANVRQQSRVRG